MKINNYENYEVLMDGVVIGARGRKLKVDLNSCGYERVTLSRDGITTRRFVHKIVAETFLGPSEGRVVNHIDGNRRNNCVSNLEWVSPSDNVKDGYLRGRRNPNKYPDWLIDQLIVGYICGWSIKDLARRWGKDRGTVAKYVRHVRQELEGATTIRKE